MTSIPSWAIPGAKVVCVEARATLGVLIEGDIYTIAAIDEPFIVLEEVPVGGPYKGADPQRFRPLSLQEQDLELFRPMLTQPGNLPSEMDDQEAIVDACLYAVNKAWGAS